MEQQYTFTQYLKQNFELSNESSQTISDILIYDLHYCEISSRVPILYIGDTGHVLYLHRYGIRIAPPIGSPVSKGIQYNKYPELKYTSITTAQDVLDYVNAAIFTLEL